MLSLVDNENIRHDYNQRIVDNTREQNNCCLKQIVSYYFIYMITIFILMICRANVGEQLLLAYTSYRLSNIL